MISTPHLWPLVVLLAAGTAQAGTNLIRNGGFDAEPNGLWSPAEKVAVERIEPVEGADGAVLKVSWANVTGFTQWARAGNLLRATGRILSQPLQRDTRYRLSLRMKVVRFDVAPESLAWYAKLPKGQFDPPTITVGCQGGHWNSGMPWMAYDVSKLGTWQQLQCEFVTPFNGAGGFALTVDAYPCYNAPMRSSGVLYLDDVRLEVCPPRVGFTWSRRPKQIDGDLSDWWQTNPVVITCDQVINGHETPNRDASGLFYTMWDERFVYVAAKVIDDDVTGADGVAVLLDEHEYFVSRSAQPAGCRAAVRLAAGLGGTANMYRIVSQYGEDVRQRGGYVVEMAIPMPAARAGRTTDGVKRTDRIAFEIRDVDASGQPRRLRYPCGKDASGRWTTAEIAWANERGELRGGERPVYAVTDAANDRTRPRTLAVKNVAAHVVVQGRIGYPSAVYRGGERRQVDAVISWTTNRPASGRLEYGSDPSYGHVVEGTNAVGEPTGNAMRVVLRGLEPNRRYHFRVVARAADGDAQASSDNFVLDTSRPFVEGVPSGEVPLTVTNTAAVARHAWPVTSGVPFPEGHLGSADHVRLLDESNRTVAAQFVPLAEWPDGSIKWLLVDFQTDLPADGLRRYGSSQKICNITTEEESA